jgi:hypothetical protein
MSVSIEDTDVLFFALYALICGYSDHLRKSAVKFRPSSVRVHSWSLFVVDSETVLRPRPDRNLVGINEFPIAGIQTLQTQIIAYRRRNI